MELLLSNLELYAPVTLGGLRLTDSEFLSFCSEHEDLRVESNHKGEVEVMPGTGPDSGRRNMLIGYHLTGWSMRDGSGESFDSSTLFVLPSGARRSPDASWIRKERVAAIPAEQHGHLWHIAPDFVIELRSASDRLPNLEAKMEEWIANGVSLAWLIDPENRTVAIYRPGAEPVRLANPAVVEGEGPVTGFRLDLAEIWR